MGGEDFAFYLEARVPGCFVGLGIRNEQIGATHFVLPEPSRWWLDHYAELSHHLETRCRVVFRNDDICRIYSLIDGPRGAATIETDTLAAVVTEFRARFDRDPMILNWDTGRDLARELRSGRVILADARPPGQEPIEPVGPLLYALPNPRACLGFIELC